MRSGRVGLRISPGLVDELRTRRLQSRVSQADLADSLGVRQQSVSLWERGDAPVERLRDWAAALDVEPESLVPHADTNLERMMLLSDPGPRELELPDGVGLELAGLMGKLDRLSPADLQIVESMVDRLLES